MANLIFRNTSERSFKKDWTKDPGFTEFLVNAEREKGTFSDRRKVIKFGEYEIIQYIKANLDKFFITEDDKPLQVIYCNRILIPLIDLVHMASPLDDLSRMLDPNKPIFWDTVRKGKEEFKEVLSCDIFRPIHGFSLKDLANEENPKLIVRVSQKRIKEIPVCDLYVPLTSFKDGKFFYRYYDGNIIKIDRYLVYKGLLPQVISVTPLRDYYLAARGLQTLASYCWFMNYMKSDSYSNPEDCKISVSAVIDEMN